MKFAIVFVALFYWIATPSSSYAEEGHEHSEEEHTAEKKHEGSEEKHSEEEEHKDHAEGGEHAEQAEEGEHGDHAEEGEHGDHAEEGGHDDHGGGSGIGPGKAILEVADEGNKFKLSKESESFLKIKTSTIEALGDDSFRIPKQSVVSYQNSKGVYLKSGDWFEIRSIKVLSTQGENAVVTGKNMNSSSMVASAGLGFLRAAHLQASGQGGKGHAH